MFDNESLVPYGHKYKDDVKYEEDLKELDSLWKTDKKLEDYSDYGVLLVYLGRYEEAEKVFLEIEKINPGLYATAVNLGTTYELLGKNELALNWIKKGVRIDPTSHNHSEWLHVKILEAKLKGDKYINSDFLIGTNFGTDTLPKTTLDSASLVKLRDAIFYQLEERVTFIKPQEKIVALLLFELGNVCALTDDVTSALRIYDKAKEYGFKSDVLDKRYNHFLSMQAVLDNEYSKQPSRSPKGNQLENDYTLSIIIIISLAMVAGLLFIQSKKKSR